MVMHPHHEESILILGIRFTLVLTILELEFLHRELERTDFGVEGVDPRGLFSEFGFARDYTVHVFVTV